MPFQLPTSIHTEDKHCIIYGSVAYHSDFQLPTSKFCDAVDESGTVYINQYIVNGTTGMATAVLVLGYNLLIRLASCIFSYTQLSVHMHSVRQIVQSIFGASCGKSVRWGVWLNLYCSMCSAA